MNLQEAITFVLDAKPLLSDEAVAGAFKMIPKGLKK